MANRIRYDYAFPTAYGQLFVDFVAMHTDWYVSLINTAGDMCTVSLGRATTPYWTEDHIRRRADLMVSRFLMIVGYAEERGKTKALAERSAA
jgi:hypothetical protein